MIKLFQTSSGQNYAYDALSNKIITVGSPGDDLDEQFVEQQLVQAGVIESGPFDEIVYVDSFETYREKIEHSLSGLTLEISQQCNLRCDYCIYSGGFENQRSHGDKYMSQEIISKSIDFYLAHRDPEKRIFLSFYGGEALLNFERIKYAIKTVLEKTCDANVLFNISSNGVLLNKDLVKWLNDNPYVNMIITLNGPFHDNYRKFPNGKGSLAVICDNLQYVKDNYSNVWKNQISFITNFVSLDDVNPLLDYFKEIGKMPVSFTDIFGFGGNDTIRNITESGQKERSLLSNDLYLEYIRTGDDNLHHFFKQSLLSSIAARPINASQNGVNRGKVPSCEPFSVKLFVTAEGNFRPCERLFNHVPLGDVNSGYNWQAIKELREHIQKVHNSCCRMCWAQRFCGVCYRELLAEHGVRANPPEEVCNYFRQSLAQWMCAYCDIGERNPDILHRFYN